jgi:hypothetical protein
MDEDLREKVLEMYRSLGGTAAKPNFRPGVWDIALADGRVVELDEELHSTAIARPRFANCICARSRGVPLIRTNVSLASRTVFELAAGENDGSTTLPPQCLGKPPTQAIYSRHLELHAGNSVRYTTR